MITKFVLKPIIANNPNICGNLKHSVADNNKVPRKPIKKIVFQKIFFMFKAQTLISSQNVGKLYFANLTS